MADRDGNGRFVKGHTRVGHTGGKARLPEDFKRIARTAPDRLEAILDDPKTPAAVKASILQWMSEMVYGKPKQQADVEITADVAVEKPLTLLEMRDLVLSLPPRGDG